MRYFIFAICAVTLFGLGTTTHAAEFDPTYLISDAEMTNYRSMDQLQIQQFLEQRAGTLAKYSAVDKEGELKTASQAFYEIAQRWLINPKYLLVLVQKEQGLLEDTSPKQGQYDRATGYGCPDSGGCDDRWKGFYRQVNSAAAQTRYYQDNINEFGFQPGRPSKIDNQTVVIKNIATAGLYNYTPHIHGNQLFWTLWTRYFSKKWPDGSLVRSSSSDTTYLIENGVKRAIASKTVFASRFQEKNVVSVSQDDLNSYEDGTPIKYANFALLRDKQDKLYMISDDTIREFESPELFKKIGFQEDELIDVSRSDIEDYEKGAMITPYSLYPAGALLQDKATKQVYYILSGAKHLVPTTEILNANFQGLTVKTAAVDELNQFLPGSPVTMPDGALMKVKGASTVYVISGGKRLPIFSGSVFEQMNFKWTNVITVSKATLESHEVGQTITGQW